MIVINLQSLVYGLLIALAAWLVFTIICEFIGGFISIILEGNPKPFDWGPDYEKCEICGDPDYCGPRPCYRCHGMGYTKKKP